MFKTITAGPVGGPQLEGRLPSSDPRDLHLGLGLFPNDDLAQLNAIAPERLEWSLKGRTPALRPAGEFETVLRVGPNRDIEEIDPGQFVVVTLPNFPSEV